MDANGQRFWLLADDRHWRARSHVSYHPACRALRLASERMLSAPIPGAAAVAASALEQLPRSVDLHGALARWNPLAMRIEACSALGPPVELLALPLRPFDFAPGFDDVLYVALDERIVLHDLRGRWPDTMLATPGFQAWRVAADPAGGAWLLERASGRLARLTGCVLPARPGASYAPTVFRPAPENPTPPTLRVIEDPGWREAERPQSITVSDTGDVALLSWTGDGECWLRTLDRDVARLAAPQSLTGVRFAYSLAWLGESKVAVRAPGRRDAPVYLPRPDLAPGAPPEVLVATGDIAPLAADAEEGPFGHSLNGPPRYPVSGPGASAGEGPGIEPLHRLSIAHLAARGEAASFAGAGDAHVVDSGDDATVWHRAFVEARLPTGCGICLWLAASDEPDPATASEWHPHLLGEVPVAGLPAGPLPHAVWERSPSELPGHPGLGAWGAPQPHRAGLWSVLIQRSACRVRTLVGRYLWIRVVLHGDGRDTPELAAVRAYASRFSYRDQYLPRMYRETEYGAAATRPGEALLTLPASVATDLDAAGPVPEVLRERLEIGNTAELDVIEAGARWQVRDGSRGIVLRSETDDDGDTVVAYRPQSSPADFTERFLGNVEGWLTMLEDRVAAAHLASDPAVVPEESLEWLGGWVGVAFDPALPAARRRAWLTSSAELAGHHGTRHGLALALDVATDGGVRGGEIVIAEGFRLRRLMATLLGVDLGAEEDPLLPGLIVNTNSVVGDALILGEAERLELLALFREEVAGEAATEAILAFYDRLAFRALVLVHQEVEPQDLGLVRRIVELEAPAHVEVQVATASWPLLVGIASLVGVDTYLGPPRPPRPAVAGRTHLGNGDRVLGVGSLDPRISGAPTVLPPAVGPLLPSADAGEDISARFGESFELDGGGSTAPAGRRIIEYRWRLLE